MYSFWYIMQRHQLNRPVFIIWRMENDEIAFRTLFATEIYKRIIDVNKANWCQSSAENKQWIWIRWNLLLYGGNKTKLQQ